MKTILCKISVLWIILLLLPIVGYSQIITKKVAFAPGKSSSTINAILQGDQTLDYTIEAKENQVLKVDLSVKNEACFFNVLPPGSNDVAIFIGSNEGASFSGTLSEEGVYKIRVYQMRNEARRGTKVNFSITIGLSGGIVGKSNDAKVGGTNYNATGQLNVLMGAEKSTAKFGVIRSAGNKAEVHAQIKGGLERIFLFSQNKWSCKTDCGTLQVKKDGDQWELILNDYEHYYIPEAIVYGG